MRMQLGRTTYEGCEDVPAKSNGLGGQPMSAMSQQHPGPRARHVTAGPRPTLRFLLFSPPSCPVVVVAVVVVVLVRPIQRFKDKSHGSRIRSCFSFVRSLARPAAAPLLKRSRDPRRSWGGPVPGGQQRSSGAQSPALVCSASFTPLFSSLFLLPFTFLPSLLTWVHSLGPSFFPSPHSLVH